MEKLHMNWFEESMETMEIEEIMDPLANQGSEVTLEDKGSQGLKEGKETRGSEEPRDCQDCEACLENLACQAHQDYPDPLAIMESRGAQEEKEWEEMLERRDLISSRAEADCLVGREKRETEDIQAAMDILDQMGWMGTLVLKVLREHQDNLE